MLYQDSFKLSQIYPIIIDDNILHNDIRIPGFLKSGFTSYNLRIIRSKKVACRKIEAQFLKRTLENNLVLQKKYNSFYGRDKEIKQFKDSFDSGQGIKCIICSGIEGIGRKSYLTEALKDVQIIERYYDPAVISLGAFDTIDDLIVKFSEIGFGEYTLDDIIALKSIDEKITVLSKMLQEIQGYKEHVIIYDDLCLVGMDGEVRYWFDKALDSIRNEVTISIASRANISFTYAKSKNKYFTISLSTLPYPEWNELMRTYANSLDLETYPEDREYFKDVITGFPPQVIYCVDLMKEHGIEYVKNNTNVVVENISDNVTKLLETAIKDEYKVQGYELLAFLSEYGIVPMNIVLEVLKLDSKYSDVLNRLKSLTICRLIGSSNEYVEVNPVVSDYIQRSRIELPPKINEYLRLKVEEFNSDIEKYHFEDFENIKFYLKENILGGVQIPEKFLYSTIYLRAIYELYNKQRYPQVITIMDALKENGSFDRYDEHIKTKLQRYYCLSLARENDSKFYGEVEYFKKQGMVQYSKDEYNFLRGFMFRNNCEYDKALERYLKILENTPTHRGALREIVLVYRGLEDYESSISYAQLNYQREPENPYNIQPYFESIVRLPIKNEQHINDMNNMLEMIEIIHKRKPLTAFYEINSLYQQYCGKDETMAIKILEQGKQAFRDSSYIYRALFDCYRFFGNIKGMCEALNDLRKTAKGNKSAVVALEIREAIMEAYLKKPQPSINSRIDTLKALTMEAKSRLKQEVSNILFQSQ